MTEKYFPVANDTNKLVHYFFINSLLSSAYKKQFPGNVEKNRHTKF